TTQARFRKHLDRCRHGDVFEQCLDDRPDDVLIQFLIFWNDQHLHKARSSQPVEMRCSTSFASRSVLKYGRASSRAHTVSPDSGSRPKATTLPKDSFDRCASKVGECVVAMIWIFRRAGTVSRI